MRIYSIVIASILAACVGESPDGVTGGTGNGDGTGDGTGGGDGSGGGGGDSEDPQGMTATRFLDEIGKKFCDQAFTCKASFPTDEGVTFDEAFGATTQQCYADSLEFEEPAKVEAQITAGTITWDASNAAACLAGITFGTCTQFWQEGPTMPAACDTALVGTIADGQACVTHLECSNIESYCDDTTKKCTPEPTGARILEEEMGRPAVLLRIHR